MIETGACLGLWIDFGSVLLKDLSDFHFIFLCAQMHWCQSVLGFAVGVSAIVEQQCCYVCVAERGCQMQRTVPVLQHHLTKSERLSFTF